MSLVSNPHWQHSAANPGFRGEAKVVLSAFTANDRGEPSMEGLVSPGLVTQVLRDPMFLASMRDADISTYRGGAGILVPENLSCVSADTFPAGEVEMRVVSIIQRGKLPCGAQVCKVRARNTLTDELDDYFVTPEGVDLVDYAVSHEGEYVYYVGSSCQAKARFLSFSLDPRRPVMPGGVFNVVRYKWRLMKYELSTLFNSDGDASQVIRLDRKLLNYLYAQRLHTSASLSSASVSRLIESAAVKRSSKETHETTLKSTVSHFIAKYTQDGAVEHATTCFIEDLSTAPNLFDPEITVINVGSGFFKSSECILEIDVVENGNLTEKNSRGATFVEGVLTFDTPYAEPANQYLYGPHIATGAVKYSVKSTNNASQGLKRMTNSRAVSSVTGFSERNYRVNADYWLMCELGYGNRPTREVRECAQSYAAFGDWGLNHTKFRQFRQLMTDRAEEVVQGGVSLFDAIVEQQQLLARAREPEVTIINSQVKQDRMSDYAHLEHVKRAERVATYEKMVASPYLFDQDCQKKFVNGKVKWEAGKTGKCSRQFVSLGPEKTLFAPQIPEFYKSVMAEEVKLVFRGLDISFRFWKSPDEESINQWARRFVECAATPNSCLIDVHSDDSDTIVPVVVGGVRYQALLCIDIAKCDLSHSPGLFVVLTETLVSAGFERQMVMDLLKQLQLDLKISHPNRKVDEFILFKVNYMLLFTGHTITTLINNYASMVLLSTVVATIANKEYENRASLQKDILTAAGMAGYEVTLDAFVLVAPGDFENDEWFLQFQKDLSTVTFLKHYPVYTLAGEVVALKDISTVLRGYGVSDDPVDGLVRSREIVRGWDPTPDTMFTEVAFSQLGLVKTPSVHRIADDSYEWRYGVATSEVREALTLLFSLRDPVLVTHPALDAILLCGYGLNRLRSTVLGTGIYSGQEQQMGLDPG